MATHRIGGEQETSVASGTGVTVFVHDWGTIAAGESKSATQNVYFLTISDDISFDADLPEGVTVSGECVVPGQLTLTLTNTTEIAVEVGRKSFFIKKTPT